MPLDLLEPNPFQPRTTMEPARWRNSPSRSGLREFCSRCWSGRIPTAPDRFQIVAGERRWRAAGAAGLHEVPALVRDMADTDAAAVALVENLQRQDLNAIDEAEGYDRLLHQFGLTQEALGQAVGKSRSHVTNILRLLNLPPAVKEAVRKGDISAGHARALLAHSEPEAAMREVIARQLSVRQTEALATRETGNPVDSHYEPRRGPDAMALEHCSPTGSVCGCGLLSTASRE